MCQSIGPIVLCFVWSFLMHASPPGVPCGPGSSNFSNKKKVPLWEFRSMLDDFLRVPQTALFGDNESKGIVVRNNIWYSEHFGRWKVDELLQLQNCWNVKILIPHTNCQMWILFCTVRPTMDLSIASCTVASDHLTGLSEKVSFKSCPIWSWNVVCRS